MLPPLHSLGPPTNPRLAKILMGGLAESFYSFYFLVQYLPHLDDSAFLLILLRSVASSGGRSFLSAPALFFFPFSRGGRRKPASQESATWEQKQNRPKWWKLADSSHRIHFSLPLGTNTGTEAKHFTVVQRRSIKIDPINETTPDTEKKLAI